MQIKNVKIKNNYAKLNRMTRKLIKETRKKSVWKPKVTK